MHKLLALYPRVIRALMGTILLAFALLLLLFIYKHLLHLNNTITLIEALNAQYTQALVEQTKNINEQLASIQEIQQKLEHIDLETKFEKKQAIEKQIVRDLTYCAVILPIICYIVIKFIL